MEGEIIMEQQVQNSSKTRNFWKVLGWIVGICGLLGLLITPIVLKPEGFTIMVMVAFLVAVIAGILSVTYGYTGNIKFGKAAAIIAGLLAIVLIIAYFAMALSGMSIPPRNNASAPEPAASVSPAPAATQSAAPAATETPTDTNSDAELDALLAKVEIRKDGKLCKLKRIGKFLFYDETGVDGTATYDVKIPEGIVIIVDSYQLNGQNKGHLVAYDESTKVTLHNGAIGLCLADDGAEVFTDRYIVLATNHWAKDEVKPLEAWNWEAPKIDD